MVSRDPRRTRSEQDLALPDTALANLTGNGGQGQGGGLAGNAQPGGEFYTAVGPDGEFSNVSDNRSVLLQTCAFG